MNKQYAVMKYDPRNGAERPYPSHAQQFRDYHGAVAWFFNPWTGQGRTPEDVGTDTFGFLIVAPGEPLRSAVSASSVVANEAQEMPKRRGRPPKKRQ